MSPATKVSGSVSGMFAESKRFAMMNIKSLFLGFLIAAKKCSAALIIIGSGLLGLDLKPSCILGFGDLLLALQIAHASVDDFGYNRTA